MIPNGAAMISNDAAGTRAVDPRALARAIDHTNLRPEATGRDIEALCVEAAERGFAAVCVNPCRVALAVHVLSGTPVAVCTVVGFPLGATTGRVKVVEAQEAVEHGAGEIDMVLNVGRLRSGDLRAAGREVLLVRKAIGGRTILKVILETALLTETEKHAAALLAVDAGADFLKTSTGMNPAGGATPADVRLLARLAGDRARVKAAGGIRDTKTALAMLAAGASRIGTSAGVAILDGLVAPGAARAA